MIPNRHGSSTAYRYGFNGKELDNELKGEGNSYDFEKRFHDPRIGRFLSIDPLEKQFPWYTPYQFAGNTPIQAIDLDGAEEYHYTRIVDKLGNTTGLKLIKAVDIYEKQWKPQKDENSFLGFALWETVKNPRKEYVVHQTDVKPMDDGMFKVTWVKYDESVTFDNLKDANKCTGADFDNTGADIEHRIIQGLNNIAAEQKYNVGPGSGSLSGSVVKAAKKLPIEADASRINLARGRTRFTPTRGSTGQPVSAGWDHVVDGHFGKSLSGTRSIFTVSQDKLKSILQSKNTINSPVTALDGGQFKRTVNTGEVVGNANLKQGGGETTWIDVITDKKGNLITTYPVAAPSTK
ncbi:YD repeat-containing protein [Flavobacterium columnare]|nr:YD repeat-containing protein [Flavobacterium columnare]APT22128.1 hypothetical protein BU993_05455 [Flavobacterium columnare]